MSAFVKNLWYMAAWANEVPEGGMLARTYLGVKRVIFRGGDGAWAMLADRCPHRFAALSKGTCEGGIVRCGYHGLAFDKTGACVHAPLGGELPPAARVESLPIVERHGILWFWPGDPAKADPAAIPDFAFAHGDPNQVPAWLRMEVNYEFVTDNLMDLTHVEHIHRESFGTNDGSMRDHGTMSVTTDASGAIWCNWDIAGAPPTAQIAPLMPAGAKMDQWLHMRWHAPASMALYIGFARAGTDRQELVIPAMNNPHILTPETEGSTHYFFTHEPGARDFAFHVFLNEDEPMIRSAEDGFGGEDFWAARPVILASDAGAVRARRHLMQLRRAEAGQDA